MNIILFLIYCLICLTIIHYVYQRIILPSLRLNIRFNLFALRDELRNLKLNYKNQIPEKVYKYLQDAINNALNLMPTMDIATIIKARETMQNNKALNERIEKRLNSIQNCEIKEIKELYFEISKIFFKILFLNNGMLFLYLLPIIFLVVFYQKIKDLINNIAVAPENDLKKFTTSISMAVS